MEWIRSTGREGIAKHRTQIKANAKGRVKRAGDCCRAARQYRRRTAKSICSSYRNTGAETGGDEESTSLERNSAAMNGNKVERRAARKGKAGDEAIIDDMLPVRRGQKASFGKNILKKLKLEVHGIEPADLCAILSVYFVQGSLNLSAIARTLFLKDELHLEPASVSFIEASVYIPWMIKPLYGFISDSIPLYGYHRRSYLSLCGILGFLSWLSLGLYVNGPSSAFLMFIGGSVGTACSDVIVDSIVVERSRDQDTAGSLQSICWGAYAGGAIVASFFSGYLVEQVGSRNVFIITALLPLIVLFTSFIISEETKKVSQKVNIQSQIVQQSKKLVQVIRQPAILYPAMFLFLFQATPNPETALFFFKTEKLKFSPDFLGQVSFVSRVAMLLGVGIYNSKLKQVPLRDIFKWVTITGFFIGITQLVLISGLNKSIGISDKVFAMGDTALLTVLGQLSFMPLLVLAAQICPEGVEATLFATLMSTLNSGSFTGTSFGAVLTKLFGVTSENMDNLFSLVLLCTILSLSPLLFLNLIPKSITSQEKDSL